MDYKDVVNQKLSIVIPFYGICLSCGFVDNDINKLTQVEHPCRHCDNKGFRRSYFPNSVNVLIDLMQEIYHSESMVGAKYRRIYNTKKEADNAHRLAVVIFFVTLGEVLLEHFLREFMTALEIPLEKQKNILLEYLSITKRIQKLFKNISKREWMDVIKEIHEEETNQFYCDVRNARNDFVHKGDDLAIPEEMPANCIDKIRSILNLFISLHNYFIPDTYKNKKRNYSSII